MNKKGEIYDLHEEIFNNGPLLKLTHEECEQLASFLVEIDYRKASDVVREIFEEIDNAIIKMISATHEIAIKALLEEDDEALTVSKNAVGIISAVRDVITELKKKYESEGEG